MKKILFIGTFLSKKRGTMGISEKLSIHLDKEYGLRICLVSRKENKWLRFIEILISCITFTGNIIHVDVFSDRAFIISEVVLRIGQLRGKKTICNLRGGKLPLFHQKHPMQIEEVLRKADLILTPSLYIKKYFEKNGLHVKYLPNSIVLDNFHYKPHKITCAKLLWVRAFSAIYRPTLAIKILCEVRKEIPSATLTMVGPDKGELYKVRTLIQKYNLDNFVQITGPVPNRNLYQYFHTHSVFLNTTAFESFGQAVMEAAACGIPIVSTNVGEIPILWKDEKEILIVNEPNPELFADAIIRILSDQNLQTMLSTNARKKAEQFDWKVIKEKWIEILTSP